MFFSVDIYTCKAFDAQRAVDVHPRVLRRRRDRRQGVLTWTGSRPARALRRTGRTVRVRRAAVRHPTCWRRPTRRPSSGASVERVVFDEFFANTPEMLAEEYDPYEAGEHVLVRRRPPAAGAGRRHAVDRPVRRAASRASTTSRGSGTRRPTTSIARVEPGFDHAGGAGTSRRSRSPRTTAARRPKAW